MYSYASYGELPAAEVVGMTAGGGPWQTAGDALGPHSQGQWADVTTSTAIGGPSDGVSPGETYAYATNASEAYNAPFGGSFYAYPI